MNTMLIILSTVQYTTDLIIIQFRYQRLSNQIPAYFAILRCTFGSWI